MRCVVGSALYILGTLLYFLAALPIGFLVLTAGYASIAFDPLIGMPLYLAALVVTLVLFGVGWALRLLGSNWALRSSLSNDMDEHD